MFTLWLYLHNVSLWVSESVHPLLVKSVQASVFAVKAPFFNMWLCWGIWNKDRIWLICIFIMAAKMAELCSEQHIFQSSVHNFYCMVVWLSNFHMYLCLRSSRKLLTFDSFAYYGRQNSKFVVWTPHCLYKKMFLHHTVSLTDEHCNNITALCCYLSVICMFLLWKYTNYRADMRVTMGTDMNDIQCAKTLYVHEVWMQVNYHVITYTFQTEFVDFALGVIKSLICGLLTPQTTC